MKKTAGIMLILALCCALCLSSCIPSCVGLAFVDYENLGSNLNAPSVDKKLGRALENGYYEAAVEALQDGADVDKTVVSIFTEAGGHDYRTLSACISHGNERFARLLLENGADPNYRSEGCSLLYYALQEGQYDIAEELIEYGADVNSTMDYNGNAQPPLYVFISEWYLHDYPCTAPESNESVFDALLKNGAVMPQETLEEMISQADTAQYDLRYIQRVVQQGDYSLPSPVKEIVTGDSEAAAGYLDKITSLDGYSKTSLIIYASAFCDSKVIGRLIELGCDINTIIADDVNLLSVAARYNTPEAAEYLYNKGIDFACGGDGLKFADYAAVLNRNSDTIKYIDGLKHCDNYFALSLACRCGNDEYLELYADYLKTLDEGYKQELLGYAALNDSLDIIKLLRTAGLNDFSAAAEYVGIMSDETLNYLLSDCELFKNADDINSNDHEFLRYAIKSGNPDRVKLMVESGALVNGTYYFDTYDKDRAPIFTAIYYGTAEIAGYLIEKGADVEKKDSYGYTPLMCSVDAMSHNMVSLLLDSGADPTVQNQDGKTAADLVQEEYITEDDEKMPKLS
ncbi:MAG: ankyrin repeat domain-containing protein [Acutalibacteraceae bacterium]